MCGLSKAILLIPVSLAHYRQLSTAGIVARMGTRAPRSVADDIRSRSAEQLQALISNRPDLVNPMPADLAELAARVTNPTSVRMALDNLDARQLRLLQELSANSAVRPLAEFVQASTIEPARIQELWDRALLWGQPPNGAEAVLFVAGPVRTILGEAFGGVSAAGDEGDQDSGDNQVWVESASEHSEAIEVVSVGTREAGQVNASQVAMHAAVLVDDVAHWIQSTCPSLRKSGGLGVRELTALAGDLELDAEQAGFWLELSAQAGFLGLATVDSWGADFAIVLAESFDAWSHLNFSNQWLELVRVWSTTDSAPQLINTETPEGERVNALSGKAKQSSSPSVRMAVLRALADVDSGQGLSESGVQQVARQRFPRLDQTLRQDAAWQALVEGEWLGVVARVRAQGVPDTFFLTELGRAWLHAHGLGEEVDDADDAVAKLFPAEVDQVIAQADMTLVVPGPPAAGLRKLLSQVAHRESTGGATVYRLTPATLRTALKLGADPQEILAELSLKSLTPIPQPMQYLISDSAKSTPDDTDPNSDSNSGAGSEATGRLRAQRSLDGYTSVVGNSKAGFGVPLSADRAEVLAVTLWGTGPGRRGSQEAKT